MTKNKFINLGRTIKLVNISLFKNPRVYILGIILPIFISALLEFLWDRYSNTKITASEMLSFMYVSLILSSFYIGIFANEMRQNVLKKIIDIKNNNQNILKFSLMVLALEMSAIDLLLDTLIFYIIAQFNTLGFYENLFDKLMGFVWVYYVIFGLMLGTISSLIFLIVGSLFNNNLYSILLMSIAFIFMLIFSDTIIPSKTISNNNAMNVIGYFNPIKYTTWSVNLISSYQFEDSWGKLEIYSPKGNSFEPFNALWQTTMPAIVLLILLFIGYAYKKEEK